jgi:hypothetical protein
MLEEAIPAEVLYLRTSLMKESSLYILIIPDLVHPVLATTVSTSSLIGATYSEYAARSYKTIVKT